MRPTNYFKVTYTTTVELRRIVGQVTRKVRKKRTAEEFFFFDDTSQASTETAYVQAVLRADNVFGKVSKWRGTCINGPWEDRHDVTDDEGRVTSELVVPIIRGLYAANPSWMS